MTPLLILIGAQQELCADLFAGGFVREYQAAFADLRKYESLYSRQQERRAVPACETQGEK